MTRSGSKPPESPSLGPVKVQKRVESTPSQSREKACASCGRAFVVQEGEKYYLCPDCYRKEFLKPKRRKTGAQVLNHITCSACGAQEYLSFVPTDPAEALCKACFAQQKREQKRTSQHPDRT